MTVITRYPTAVVNGTGWTNPSNALTRNDTPATATTDLATIVLGTFDFSDVPDNAIINSITLGFRFQITETRNAYSDSVQARISGSPIGSAVSTTAEPASYTDYTGDGGSITIANLKNSGFELAFVCDRTSGTRSFVVSLDCDWVTLDYSVPTQYDETNRDISVIATITGSDGKVYSETRDVSCSITLSETDSLHYSEILYAVCTATIFESDVAYFSDTRDVSCVSTISGVDSKHVSEIGDVSGSVTIFVLETLQAISVCDLSCTAGITEEDTYIPAANHQTPDLILRLSDPDTIPSGDTDHFLLTVAKVSTGTGTLHLELREWLVPIESWTVSLTTDWSTDNHSFDPSNIANITDYTNLSVKAYVEGSAGAVAQIAQINLLLPLGVMGEINRDIFLISTISETDISSQVELNHDISCTVSVSVVDGIVYYETNLSVTSTATITETDIYQKGAEIYDETNRDCSLVSVISCTDLISFVDTIYLSVSTTVITTDIFTAKDLNRDLVCTITITEIESVIRLEINCDIFCISGLTVVDNQICQEVLELTVSLTCGGIDILVMLEILDLMLVMNLFILEAVVPFRDFTNIIGVLTPVYFSTTFSRKDVFDASLEESLLDVSLEKVSESDVELTNSSLEATLANRTSKD